jgi:single-strand DNA-binding protein
MSTVNQVILEGNLCKDAEFKVSKKGTKFSTFPLAVNRSYKDFNGTFQKEVLFIDVEVWGDIFQKKLAEFGKKGQGVRLVGRLRQGKWERDGKRYSKMYAVAETLDACLIGKKGSQNTFSGGNDSVAKDLANLAVGADGLKEEITEPSSEDLEDEAVF